MVIKAHTAADFAQLCCGVGDNTDGKRTMPQVVFRTPEQEFKSSRVPPHDPLVARNRQQLCTQSTLLPTTHNDRVAATSLRVTIDTRRQQSDCVLVKPYM